MAIEFRLLGDVEAQVNGRLVDIGHIRQRCVLAVLLVDANRLVPADQLVERVWGVHRRPHRPANALQTYISLIRRALADLEQVRIRCRSGSYRLTVDPATVDLHRFRELTVQGQAAEDEQRAAALFEQALRLWRGEPFATLDTPWLTSVRAILNRERHAAQLDLIDLQLRRGHHAAMLAELTDLAGQHPWDERLAGQLMLALYRCGRSTEALEHYRQIRHRLAEELGTDPSTVLQRLHQQILTADSALAAPTAGVTVRVARPAVVPQQLPAATRLFTGRTRELATLTATLDAQPDAEGTMAISAISGMGGIGKTWLALHWAHQHRHRFPDGQLYVNLRGFDPTGEPMTSTTALRGFLDALGVDPAAIPADQQAQVGLYRSLVADKRLLILLDNAAGTDQVAPLLPGSPTCLVLITSRNRLTSLINAYSACPLPVDVLTDMEARQLLAARFGADRLAAEPDAVAELLASCAGFPLALSIVAGRAQTHPDFPLADLAAELRDATTRLDTFDDDPAAGLPAVLSWSYAALPAEQRRVFGLLGIAAGPELSLPAAANLTGLPTSQVWALLRGLDQVHLVQQHVPGRYRMHDLVKLYAANRAQHDLPQTDRTEGLRRLVDFYLHTAHSADRLLDPHRQPIRLDPSTPDCHPLPLPDPTAALAWLDAEHPSLLATQRLAADRGWHSKVWQLAWVLDTFHHRRGHLPDQLAAWQTGLTAAQQENNPTTLLLAHRNVGSAYSILSRPADALDHLGHALALAQDTGDRFALAHVYRALAWALEQQGDCQRALEHATKALHLYRALDQPVWEADLLNAVGWCSARLGHYQQARTYCQAALAIYRRHRDREGEGNTLDSLGYLAHKTGQHHQALNYYQQALSLRRDLGHTYYEANTLDHLGQTHATLGHHNAAHAAWQQALNMYRAQHRTTDVDRIQQQLDTQPISATRRS